MPSLFGGVENFVPAFQRQQLAIQAGQGAGQSISRGMRVAQAGKRQDFELNGDKQLLDTMTSRLRNKLNQSPSSSPAVPWSQMPIPPAASARPGVAVPWDEMPIPGPIGPRTGEAVPWDEMPIPGSKGDPFPFDLPPDYPDIEQ